MDRDRDADGRARNARPRDGLGRPLAHGATGVARQPEGVVRTPDDTVAQAQRLLDADRPFHAHEVFEDAWKSAGPQDAALWKGLAQLAVGVTHRRRGNPVGAHRLLRRSAVTLAPYRERRPHGIDIAGLLVWASDPGDRPVPPLRAMPPEPSPPLPRPLCRPPGRAGDPVPTLISSGASVAFSDTGPPPGRPQAPTVVFGHGLLFSGWMFAAQIEALRATYRCVAIDWRGQGDSPPSAGGYDMDTLAADAEAVITHLDVGPVHYVGLSMGGFVGQRVAARRPQLIRSLTLLDTSAGPEDRAAARLDRVLAHVFRVVGVAPVRRPVTKILFGPAFPAGPRGRQVVAEWAERLSRSDRAGIRRAVLAVANRPGVAAEIGRISAPTLVIVGADDVPTPVDRSREIVAAIPDARLEIVAECGHSSTVEQPAAVTALVMGFLRDVDARS